MTPKSRKGLPLLTMFSTFCSFDAGFPHLCAVKARKRAVAPAFFLVQQPLRNFLKWCPQADSNRRPFA